jgi:hypothetical protein
VYVCVRGRDKKKVAKGKNVPENISFCVYVCV